MAAKEEKPTPSSSALPSRFGDNTTQLLSHYSFFFCFSSGGHNGHINETTLYVPTIFPLISLVTLNFFHSPEKLTTIHVTSAQTSKLALVSRALALRHERKLFELFNRRALLQFHSDFIPFLWVASITTYIYLNGWLAC